jgi:hypothetical protein
VETVGDFFEIDGFLLQGAATHRRSTVACTSRSFDA